MQIGYSNLLEFGEKEAGAAFTTQDNSQAIQTMAQIVPVQVQAPALARIVIHQ